VTHSTTTAKTRRLWQKRQSYVPYYQQVQSVASNDALWRPFEMMPDLIIPLRYSVVGSSLVTGALYFVGSSFCFVIRIWGWFPKVFAAIQTKVILQVNGGIFLVCASVLFFVLTRKVLKLDDVYFKVRGREYEEEPEQQEPDTRPIPLSPRKKRNSPTSHSTRLPQIPTPAAGREWLARWFARIVGRDGVGFSQGVAEKYRISRQECKAIQDVFVGQDWAERKSRKGGLAAVTLNDDGLDAMREVIESHYPDARV
jgi:hypothetical protein